MMPTMFIFLFLFEVFLLIYLSSKLTTSLSAFFYRITRSKTLTIYLLSILFLPGTIIHELSHFLVAGLLFVPVGDMEFMPKLIEGGVKLGSVAIAQTDPMRRALIGLAPIMLGIGLLLVLTLLYVNGGYPIVSWTTVIFFYFAFQVGNTMFSSKKDLEGFLEFIATIAFLGIVFIIFANIAKISLPSISLSEQALHIYLTPLTIILGIVISLDIITISFMRLIKRG